MALPSSMRAAVYRGRGELTVEERPVPTPAAGEVLLEVSHCGVCGTDLHMVMDGWGRPGSIGGHEYAGTVVEVGARDAEALLGQRVVGGPTPSCGSCGPCRAGRPSLCAGRAPLGVSPFQGAFAEYKLLAAEQLRSIPDGLTLREAALAEPLAVALHGVSASGLGEGRRVLISGAGPIGALTLAALRADGTADVTVSEPGEARRALARRLGAAEVVEPGDLEIPKLPFQLVEAPYDVAFECSGKASAVEAALAQLAPLGRLVLSGTGMERPSFDATRVILNELTVTGVLEYDADGFERALALLASGKLPNEALIEPDDVPLEGLQLAMEQLVAGARAGKVMVAPGNGARQEAR